MNWLGGLWTVPLFVVSCAVLFLVSRWVWLRIQAKRWFPDGATDALKCCWGAYFAREPGPLKFPPLPGMTFIKADGTGGKYTWTDLWGRRVDGHCIQRANWINIGFPANGTRDDLAASALPYEAARLYVYWKGLKQYDEPGGVDGLWFGMLVKSGRDAITEFFKNERERA